MSKFKTVVAICMVGGISACQSTSASFENVAQLQQLASHAYAAGDLHLAEGYWLNITQAMPEHTDAWCQLGHINYRLHRYAAAGNAYKKCLAITPNNLAAWHNLTAVKLREASATIIQGSGYLEASDNQQLTHKYQLLMRELLRLHGIADGVLGKAVPDEI